MKLVDIFEKSVHITLQQYHKTPTNKTVEFEFEIHFDRNNEEYFDIKKSHITKKAYMIILKRHVKVFMDKLSTTTLK